tara:strand:+ start:38 stop:1078 length:1041 start_codon:yes stop_codon:yes gene_type:complete
MKNEIKKFIVDENSSIFDVMRVIQEGSEQIAFVVKDEKLLGTISDGDIRRNILKNGTLDIQAKDVMRKNFKYINEKENISEAIRKFKKERINQIPIVGQNMKLIDLVLVNDLSKSTERKNNVVIMAGGKGLRLRPYTENCPKPMLKINDKPILEIIIEQCIDNGFRQFHISVNYLKNQIIDYFKDGKEWDISINYLEEEKPLGTAGSLNLLPKQEHPFIVINGDLLTRLNLNRILEFHYENQADATLCVRNYVEQCPFGIVKVDGIKLSSFEEKPRFNYLVNAGVYVINPSFLPFLEKGKFMDMPDLIQKGKQKGKNIKVCPIHEFWLDIGQPDLLKKAHDEWDSL